MNMSEGNKTEVQIDSPRKPLEPVGDGVSDEQREIYAKLLAEYERIDEMRDTQVEGVSADAYNAELAPTPERNGGRLMRVDGV